MSKELETWIERKLKGVHKNKIFMTKDGRYKTHNPQMIKTKKIDLLTALYQFYFHEKPEVRPKKLTIKNLYPKWLETYKLLIEQGHRSVKKTKQALFV